MWYSFILILYLYIHEVPTKHPREIILEPRNTHVKKIWTHEIPAKKYLDPRNTHKKKFRTHDYEPKNSNENKFSTHEIPTRKLDYIIVLLQNDKYGEHIQKR